MLIRYLLLTASFLFLVAHSSNNGGHSESATLTMGGEDNKYRAFNPKLPLSSSKKFEGSSELVNLRYHMGPILSSPINIYLIWYVKWTPSQQLLIKDFLISISTFNHCAAPSPSVSDWWCTTTLYTNQTGANISRSILIVDEYSDHLYSHGHDLTRPQHVIATTVKSKPFPVDHKKDIYLVLIATDVTMQDFCRAVCGFHYFTFPSMVGFTMSYTWVGNSGKQCPETMQKSKRYSTSAVLVDVEQKLQQEPLLKSVNTYAEEQKGKKSRRYSTSAIWQTLSRGHNKNLCWRL